MKHMMRARKVCETRMSETFTVVAEGMVSTVGRGATSFFTTYEMSSHYW